jgi:hypothetical protein
MNAIEETTTWEKLIPAMLLAYENGTPENRKMLREEFLKVAREVDKQVQIQKMIEKYNAEHKAYVWQAENNCFVLYVEAPVLIQEFKTREEAKEAKNKFLY